MPRARAGRRQLQPRGTQRSPKHKPHHCPPSPCTGATPSAAAGGDTTARPSPLSPGTGRCHPQTRLLRQKRANPPRNETLPVRPTLNTGCPLPCPGRTCGTPGRGVAARGLGAGAGGGGERVRHGHGSAGGRKQPSGGGVGGNTRASACEPGRREMVAPRCSCLSLPPRQRSQSVFSSAEPRGAGGVAAWQQGGRGGREKEGHLPEVMVATVTGSWEDALPWRPGDGADGAAPGSRGAWSG